MTLIERMKRRIGIFGYDSLSGDEREMLAALEAADAMADALEAIKQNEELFDSEAAALAAYRAVTKGEG
jgi:hypothetical protein